MGIYDRLRKYFNQRFDNWLDRRLPPADSIHLDRGKVFIFPSRAGLCYVALLIVLWLVATNYENNLVFVFTCLLTALFWVAILHSFANLSGLEIKAIHAEPAFASQRAEFRLQLQQRGRRVRDNISLRYGEGGPAVVSMPGSTSTTATLYVPAQRRGWLQPGRLTLESHYPIGLLRVWTHVQFNLRALIYPRPVTAVPTMLPADPDTEGKLEQRAGTEDFTGLDRYQPGESLRHVAWKQYAREQGLFTKQYGDPSDRRVWIDWGAFPGMDKEARLSRLTGWLLEASRSNTPYGLRLPGKVVQPDRGERHRDAILRELALFELDDRGIP